MQERHVAIEAHQATTAYHWFCQHKGCNNKVDDSIRKLFQGYRLNFDGPDKYWKSGLCPSHHVDNFFAQLLGKIDNEVIKQPPAQAIEKQLKNLTHAQIAEYRQRAAANGAASPAPSPAPASGGGGAADLVALGGGSNAVTAGQLSPADIALLQSPEFQELRRQQAIAAQVQADQNGQASLFDRLAAVRSLNR